jgi:hypothetical protein
MLSGDFICVLHGANVPFALRQQGQSWALVGECYVFNLVRGEALDEVSKRGSRLQQGWIEIRYREQRLVLRPPSSLHWASQLYFLLSDVCQAA